MLVCLPICFNRLVKSIASKTTLMFTPNLFVENVNDCRIVLSMVVNNLVVVVGPLNNGNRMAGLTARYVKIRKRRTKGALRPKKRKKGLSGKAAIQATTRDVNEPQSTFKDTQHQQSGMDVSEEEVTSLATPSHRAKRLACFYFSVSLFL